MGHNRGFVGLGSLVLLVGLLSPTAPASAWVVRWDDPAQVGQHPFLEGVLTSNSGSNKISWNPGAPSDDNVPTAQDNDQEELMWRTERHLNEPNGMCLLYISYPCSETYPFVKGTTFSSPRPPDEFVSEPLPRELLLNVTRGFQVTLFLQGHPDHPNPCSWRYDTYPDEVGLSWSYWLEPSLDVELYADDKLIGGGFANDYVSWFWVYPTKKAPDRPPGYGACYYQMHSEVATLAPGTILKLRVNHAVQLYDYPYGLAGDHRSSIRLWEYPPEEVYYRYPDLDPQDVDGGDAPEGTTSEGADSQQAGGGFAGLLAIAALALEGRRGRRVLLLTALLVSSFAIAGCISGGSKGAGQEETLRGRVDNTLVRDDRGGLTSDQLGSIIGEVYDDLHIPVRGVHVSMLGLSNFTQTDSKGRFQFIGVLPGVYKLRFDKAEYKSFEAGVEVRAGFVSRPEVMLFPVNQKEADYRPHSHDYWGGIESKVVADVTVPGSCQTWYTRQCEPGYFRINPKNDDPNTILPGTDEVTLILNWDKEKLKADRLGLAVYSLQGNSSTFAPRGPNEPFHIRTTWEMTDVGHVGYSSWLFHWFMPVSELTYEEYGDMTESNYDFGTVNAKISIHKGGRLPLEPAHPDHWGDKVTLPLIKAYTARYYIYGTMPPGAWPCTQGQYGTDCYYVYYYTAGPGKNLVAQGTKWVEFTVKQNRDTTLAPFKMKLFYKPASVPWHMANYDTLAGFKEAAPVVGGTWDKTVYRIPVIAPEADFTYAKASGWAFTFRTTDEQNMWTDYRANSGNYCAYVCLGVGAGAGPLTYTWDAVAHRDDMPK